MTHKENIRAILECHFTGFKEDIIDSACNRILEQESSYNSVNSLAESKLKKAREREAVRKNLKLVAENDIEVRKPCINYSDGCEEWAGCPCVYYKGRK